MAVEKENNPDTLMEMAVEAVDAGDHAGAMINLKRLVALSPDNATALYLLATVHAATGMNDRAVEEMAVVLEQEPDFHVARFQLGQLLLADGRAVEAMAFWEHYLALPEDDCFFLFRRGIEHLFDDRHEECIRDLEASIERNQDYDSIIEDMAGILENIRAQQVAETSGT